MLLRILPLLIASLALLPITARAGESVRIETRTTAEQAEFAGATGWLCAGAERCARRDRLEAMIATDPARLVATHGTALTSVAGALLRGLSRMGREVCRGARCSPLARRFLDEVAALRKLRWTVREAAAATAEVVHGGTLTGWQARLESGERTLELLCGRSLDGPPSCLLEIAIDGRRFRHHASAAAPGHVMLDLELLGEHGYMWMDPGMLAVGGALSK